MTTLTDSTKLSMNWGMVFKIGSILVALAVVWGNISLRLNALEIANTSNQKDIIGLRTEIEKNRAERVKAIDELRSENAQQHARLSEGQDRIINILLNRGK